MQNNILIDAQLASNDMLDVENLDNFNISDSINGTSEVMSRLSSIEGNIIESESSQTTSSNLTTTYIAHPLLANYPRLQEHEIEAKNLLIERNMGMTKPAFVNGNYLLTNAHEYEYAFQMGFDILIQEFVGTEDAIADLIESDIFFGRQLNATQRAIHAFMHIEEFQGANKLEVIKKRLNGQSEFEKYDAKQICAVYYQTSAGYITKAKECVEHYPEMVDLLYNGKLVFSSADKIMKYKKTSPEFYHDLLNGKIEIANIRKYKQFLIDDTTIYNMVANGTVDIEDGQRLLKVYELDKDVYETFINGSIPIRELNSTLKRLEDEAVLKNTPNVENNIKDNDNGNALDTKTDSNQNEEFEIELTISYKVKRQIQALAASSHITVDELLSSLLEKFDFTTHTTSSEVDNGIN